MSDLVAFLRARLDEDESVVMATCGQRPNPESTRVPHGAARLLADITAKRAIVEACEQAPEADLWGRDILRMLVQPYARHLYFDPAWRT